MLNVRRDSKYFGSLVTVHVDGGMGAEATAVGPMSTWGTWEELILGGAVLRHGTRDWNVVASELRARTLHPESFTPEVCKAKFEDLQKRYAGSTAWFEELRKQRVAELKQELARSEDSIGSLESKIKSLEAERQNSNQADYDLPQTESPPPVLNSEGIESVCKEALKDENSAGSFTKGTGATTNWLCEPHNQEIEIDTKPDVSVSSEQGKELSVEKLAEAGYAQGVTVRKRRGQRKRKNCHQAVKEGSVEESDNVGSSNVVSTVKRKGYSPAVKQESDNVRSPSCVLIGKRKGCSQAVKGESSSVKSSNGAKRKDCNGAVRGESDNVKSSNGVSTAKRKDCNGAVKGESDDVKSSNGASTAKRKDGNREVKGESDDVKSSNGVSTAKRKDCSQTIKEGRVWESNSVGSCKGVSTLKRKDCKQAVKEGSVAESDNIGSSIGTSTAQKETLTTDCDQITRNSCDSNHNGVESTAKRLNLMDIFQSIASSEPAAVFRHRMDSQKRARYRKVIKQHLDIGTIRSRITGQSIKSIKELFRDLLLLANNALVFYSRRTREYKSALSLRNLVMKEYKQHCRESSREAMSAFLLPFSPPVRPRTARPRPVTRLGRAWAASEKLSSPEKVDPVKETPCDSESNVSLNSWVKAKKGVKRPGKAKPELGDTQQKPTPVRQRKRVRK